MNISGLNKKVKIILTVFMLTTVTVFIYLYFKKENNLAINHGSETKSDVSIIEDVGKLVELPVGEKPTVATISDTEALKSQPFFNNAKVGDKVLIYTNAKKAIIYRPSKNIIVEIAPLSMTLR